MSLSNLNPAELQNLLMDLTKQYTTCLRKGCGTDEKKELKEKIDEIVRILEESKTKNDSGANVS
jgi:hypothetical protein